MDTASRSPGEGSPAATSFGLGKKNNAEVRVAMAFFSRRAVAGELVNVSKRGLHGPGDLRDCSP